MNAQTYTILSGSLSFYRMLQNIEYNVFLFDEPLKGSKSLKIFKISLTFRFGKLSNLSKSVHIGENSQILTVSNKKITLEIASS
jgi:hypothetical protein